MDAAELGFNAWVLIPNVLTVAQRWMSADDRIELQRLSEVVEPLSPQQILSGLTELSIGERALIRDAYVQSSQRLESEAEAVLGLPSEIAAHVIDFLQSPESAA